MKITSCVHPGMNINVDLSPRPNQHFVAGSDYVVSGHGNPLNWRKCRGYIVEEPRSINSTQPGRPCHKLLEIGELQRFRCGLRYILRAFWRVLRRRFRLL